MKTDYQKKALDIINNKGVKEWLKQRNAINFEAIRHGYCVDIEGNCEEDRCDCAGYRGLSDEKMLVKFNERCIKRKSSQV